MLRLSLCAAAFAGLILATPLSDAVAAEVPSATGKKPTGKKGGKKGKKGKKKKGDDFKGPFKKKKYPKEVRLRPLVLPNGMGEVDVNLGLTGIPGGDIGIGTNAGFTYGVADVVDFGVSTGLLLSPDVDWNGAFNLEGHYLAVDGRDFDFAPGLVVPIFRDAFGDVGLGVTLDMPCRYIVADQVFIYFGRGAVPITFGDTLFMSINANGGVGYQVNKSVLLFADTTPLILLLAPDADVTGLWEFLALNLGGQYSIDKYIDVGGTLSLTTIWDLDDSFFWTLSGFGAFRF